MTRVEFRNMLKDGAMKLLSGEENQVEVTQLMIGVHVEDSETINETYIRNAINQYGKFKQAGGRVKVSARGEKYVITLMSEEEKRRISPPASKDVRQVSGEISAASMVKIVTAIIEAQPDLSDLTGKQLESAVRVMALYRASLIEKLKEITNHE